MQLDRNASFGPRGRGATFDWTIFDSPLGRILIAGTFRGLSFVAIGDSDRILEREMRGDYPEGAFRRSDDSLRDSSGTLSAFLNHAGALPHLPLDIRGTEFQFKVWDELCAIPVGTTRTYGEIARRIGHPDAPRAVGAAVGANPVSILIPCHRAVAADGSLHNYRWGIDRKRQLLELERRLRGLGSRSRIA